MYGSVIEKPASYYSALIFSQQSRLATFSNKVDLVCMVHSFFYRLDYHHIYGDWTCHHTFEILMIKRASCNSEQYMRSLIGAEQYMRSLIGKKAGCIQTFQVHNAILYGVEHKFVCISIICQE